MAASPVHITVIQWGAVEIKYSIDWSWRLRCTSTLL